MKTIPDRVHGKRARARANESGSARSLPRRRLAHELMNHLSVIRLCCFKLHRTLGERGATPGTKEFEAIENAVQEAAKLIRKL